jgi:hypothetical protein
MIADPEQKDATSRRDHKPGNDRNSQAAPSHKSATDDISRRYRQRERQECEAGLDGGERQNPLEIKCEGKSYAEITRFTAKPINTAVLKIVL